MGFISGRVILESKLTDGATGFHPRTGLSTSPFGVFRDFLRNLRKYGLGSFRKTRTENTPPTGPNPRCRQLNPTTQPSVYGIGLRFEGPYLIPDVTKDTPSACSVRARKISWF